MSGAAIHRSDVVVVGSGSAALSAALRLAPRAVTVLTKTEVGQGASGWAQGGIAVAVGQGDAPALHAADTRSVAAGLAVPEAVDILTRDGPERLGELLAAGLRADRAPGGALALGLEGGHGRRRIVHADGDATGAELMRVLAAEARRAAWIELRPRTFVAELVVEEGRVCGVLARGPSGRPRLFAAPAVILASGGLGRLFRFTTNPPEATGDGVAMAARAGALLADLEFVQFHPTALEVGEDPMPLVTEALRGAGAHLVDDEGERFLRGVEPAAELAPRDRVARAIWERRSGGHRVFLDCRHVLAESPDAFPSFAALCRRLGLDPLREPVPVAPAAHYAMGGVWVDVAGRTSLPGLWACGEVASTGVHGANRLASNSLLEALVFGARVADDVAGVAAGPVREPGLAGRAEAPARVAGAAPEALATLRRAMWRHAGLVRTEHGLLTLLKQLEGIERELAGGDLEAANLLLVSRLIATAALERRESRGAHFRRDHPAAGWRWRRRQLLRLEPGGVRVLAPAEVPAAAGEVRPAAGRLGGGARWAR